MRLLDRARPWPPRERPRRAAVSSFGIGGTNAHVIIEEPAEADSGAGRDHRVRGRCRSKHGTGRPFPHGAGAGPGAGPDRAPGAEALPAPAVPATRLPTPPWLIGGGDEAGLRAHAAKLAAALADVTGESAALDVSYSLATTRAPLSHRAAVPAADAEGLLAGLRELADGVDTPALLRGIAHTRPKVALLCAGQGAQRPGMGSELRAAFPAFDAAFTGWCEEFTPWLDRPLLEVIDSPDAALLNRTDYAQPALFAFTVALHTLLTHWAYGRTSWSVTRSVSWPPLTSPVCSPEPTRSDWSPPAAG
ncbi:acyltransferase domain-containing protein [Streptomyces sp. MS1.AVA.1]|uniref:Acyltransferase domain-containing protein n=1 Tax=Streptomyces machairae TaxID=3134109 RepID=A0ABU8UUL7_9ACTN